MKTKFDIADRLRFLLNSLSDRLWLKPLLMGLMSLAAVFLAKAVDHIGWLDAAPEISVDSVETLLLVMASSMLIIATFAVASMVSAYASASRTATPRAVTLVIADDVSQNALSIFVGAFAFSLIALVASKNDFFQTTGRFVLFVVTAAVFALVIITFVRWVDRIARLGRMGTTIDKVEAATSQALLRRREAPTLQGISVRHAHDDARPVFAADVGYVQRVDIAALQDFATRVHGRVTVAALPGTFASPGRPLAYINCDDAEFEGAKVTDAFVIGDDRMFDDDPRFGLVVLSEIAGRALSPAVNDPGTAIDTIGTLVRLITEWDRTPVGSAAPKYDRVAVPEILVGDMFDDAFTAIARHGAGMLEVAVRLQKAYASLASLNDEATREAAMHHARMALARSEKALELPEELDAIRKLAGFATAES